MSFQLQLTLLALLAMGGEGDWPQWRGTDGTGVASGPAPTSWSDDSNVAWKVELPGRGCSTPVIHGRRLFVTTAVSTGTYRPEEEQLPLDGPAGRRRIGEQDYRVLCLDAVTGELLWQRSAIQGYPHEDCHAMYGSFASSSPVVDGERVYASFGTFGCHAFDLEGEPLWSADFGVRLKMRRQFGESATPVLAGGLVCLLLDQEQGSFLVALDARSGEERWRVARDELTTWATPLVTEFEGQLQVITSGTKRVRAYAAESGELLWECAGLGQSAIPTPVRFEDTVLVMTGYEAPNLMAIRLGGEGELEPADWLRWSSTQGTSYTATPALVDGRLYCAMDRGFLSCFDARSGEPKYVRRRLARGSKLKASPVAAGDYLYVVTEFEDVHLVRLGDKMKVEHTNSLSDQVFIASPAVAQGRLYLRSLSHLYCIAEGTD